MSFSKEVIDDAIEHAKEEYPKESCGLVINDKYLKCKNIAKDPLNDFEIDQNIVIKYRLNKSLKGVIHSHIDAKHASKEDMTHQISNNVPWCIINLKHGNVIGVYTWGDDKNTPDLLNRDFIPGVTDCYALIRDYYIIEKNIKLKDIPREPQWWHKGGSLITDMFDEVGFAWIDNKAIKKGDVIIFAINSNTPNHTGIYNGDGTFIHHLENRKSRKEPIHIWFSYIYGYARYIE